MRASFTKPERHIGDDARGRAHHCGVPERGLADPAAGSTASVLPPLR